MGLMMKLLQHERAKAQTSPERYLDGAVRTLEGSGMHGAKPWPFDQRKAMLQYRSWVYVAASGNARRAAKQPLRLYIRKMNRFELKRRGMAPTVETRPVDWRRKRYLLHDEHGPSSTVRQKLVGFGDEFEEVTDPHHPLIDLLRRPVKGADKVSGFDAAFFKFLCLELVGNAYLHPVIGDVDGRRIPTSLWPMPPHWTQIIPARDANDHYLDGYSFGQNQREAVTLEPDEVLRFRYINPLDPLGYGIGKVEAAWSILNLHLSQRQFDIAFFDNHARPDFLLTVGTGGTPPGVDVMDRFERKVNGLLRGVRHAGSFLSLPANVTVTPLQFPPKELGDRPEVVEEIMGVFGYPITKAKANDPNRANAETGDAGWLADTIHPMLIQDEEDMNSLLLPLFGLEDDACLAYDDPVPKNRDFMLRESTSLVTAGIRTINEDRTERGMEPLEGGDEPRINGQSLELMDEQSRQAIANPAGSLGGLFGLAQPQRQIEQSSETPGYVVRLEQAIDGVRVLLDKALRKECDANDDNDEDVPPVQRKAEPVEVVAVALPGVRQQGVDSDPGSGYVAERYEAGADAGAGKQCRAVREVAEDGAEAGTTRAGGSDSSGEVGKDRSGDKPTTKDAEAEGDADRPEVSQAAIVNGEHHLCDHEPMTLKALWRTYTKAAEDNEREDEPENPMERLARELAGIFARQRDDLAAHISKIRQRAKRKGAAHKISNADRQSLNRIIDSYSDEMDRALREMLDTLTGAGGEAGLSKIGVGGAFDVSSPQASEFLNNHTVDLRRAIQNFTGDAIARTIDTGLNAGSSPAEIASQLRSDASAAGGSLSPNRSEMIARTESARAYVKGEELAWEESGVVKGKRWNLAPGACEFCRAAAEVLNAKNTKLGENVFDVGTVLRGADGGTMKLDYSPVGGPPLHPHCRCDLEPVLE